MNNEERQYKNAAQKSDACGCDVNNVNPVYTFKNGKCFMDDI